MYMSQPKMDVQDSSIKHLPVTVNNCVQRRQEDANKTSKWSVFSILFEEISQANVLFEGGGVY